MNNVNVDIRYADGRIFQCPMPNVTEAKEFAKRQASVIGACNLRLHDQITAVMVTKWNGTDTVTVVTHGQSFTY